MIKSFLKVILPKSVFAYIKKIKITSNMKKAYYYDFTRYLRYSRTLGNKSPENLAAEITVLYHVIEKGLTMPNTRLGFGEERVISLCDLCLHFFELYGRGEEQVEHAIEVILEYEYFHKQEKHNLSNLVINKISEVKNKISGFVACSQRTITKQEYFQNKENAFSHFSNSRASVRNFNSVNIPIESINEALSLAKNAPSACNRQSWRTYVVTDSKKIKEILEVQGGNRGFGHLSNKLIIIAGDISVFSGVYERNQIFIDGGMYAMNLLYALHYHEIAACILNCSHSPEKDLRLRDLLKIRESEVFIAMVACGTPPESFRIAISKRYNLDKTNILMN